MPAGDNKCPKCGQWASPNHVCDSKVEAGGTDLLQAPAAPDEVARPTTQEMHDTLHDLPGYTEVEVTFTDGDWEATQTLVARGLPTGGRGDGSHTRRYTSLTSGTEMFIDRNASNTTPQVSSVEVNEDTLPKCEYCKTNPTMDGGVCDECRGPDECITCGADISEENTSYEGQCLDCIDAQE